MAQATGTHAATVPAELPAAGYPLSADAVSHWFRTRYGRVPTELELGEIIAAMAQREATPPHYSPDAVAGGWVMGPSPSRPGRK